MKNTKKEKWKLPVGITLALLISFAWFCGFADKDDTKPLVQNVTSRIKVHSEVMPASQKAANRVLSAGFAQKSDYFRDQATEYSITQVETFVRDVALNGKLLESMIGSDQSGRAQPFCRLVDGCSGTFVKIDGKLYVATALHCINRRGEYQVEVYLDGKKVQTVTSRIAKLSRADDVALLRVDERQFKVQPRSFELGSEKPQKDDIVIAAGSWAGSGIPSWNPGSKNTAIRVLRVGNQVRQHHWELQDAAWPGASGGGIVSSDGKLIGVMSTTDSRGISTFASVSALGSVGSNRGSDLESGSQLYLVTKSECQPCNRQKAELDNLEVAYKAIDYRQARHLGWTIEQVPTLVAVNGSVPKSYLVGVTRGVNLTTWLKNYAPRALQNEQGCEDGVCPLPADRSDTTANNQIWLWLAMILLAGYVWRHAQTRQ